METSGKQDMIHFHIAKAKGKILDFLKDFWRNQDFGKPKFIMKQMLKLFSWSTAPTNSITNSKADAS